MMDRRELTIAILLVLGISFLLSLTFLHCQVPNTATAVMGRVEWVETDENDRITLVAIATPTGDYLVNDDAKGRELLQFIYKRVNVSGRIIEDRHGQKTIHVSEYRMVPQ